MAEETSLIAQQVRLSQWAEQIRDCKNRPEGMDVATWCEQHNITKANYYYRLKRVRQMCLEQMTDTVQPAFVELRKPRKKVERSAAEVPVMQIRNMQGLSAEIFSTVTPELLKCLIEAFGYAE